MGTNNKNFPAMGFSTPPPAWKPRPIMPMSERKRSSPGNNGDLFHVIHKVPAGDSPYVRAKHVQLIDKDPSRAISLFWAAINAGDRVDSALKDMSIVMKQLDRSEEAIEAIKSFRHLCPYDSQESLDNVLVDLYKRSGRIEEEIQMLQLKLKRIEGIPFGGRRTKIARSQGKKFQITVEQEISSLLGNLAWAYLQLNNYERAEEHYRKALSLEPDKNKQCNLAICLMHMNRIAEAKSLLQAVRSSFGNKPMDQSSAKSFERALQSLTELESRSLLNPIKQEEGNQNEIQRSFTSLINRNSKEGNSFTSGGQHCHSAFAVSGQWADGHDEKTVLSNERHIGSYYQSHTEDRDSFFLCGNESQECISFGQRSSLQSPPQTISIDNWKKGPHFENSGERMSSFTTRVKENWVGTQATPTSKNTYSSPTSAGKNLNVLFTQPRRPSWGFNNGYQRRRILGGDTFRSSSRKLSFEPSITTENAQAQAIQDVNGDLLVSPSPVDRDWRRSCKDLSRLKDKSVSQPTVSVDGKRIDVYARIKDEAVIEYDSQHIVSQTQNLDFCERGANKKSAMKDCNLNLKVPVEPSMVDNARTSESAIDQGWFQSCGIGVSSSEKAMTTREEYFGNNNPDVSDGLHRPTMETPESAHNNHKKSWADLVEEEEQEFLSGRTLTEYYEGVNGEEEFNDENLNSNIICQSPCPQSQIKSSSCKFESFYLKNRYGTSGAGVSSKNLEAQRSLCFDQHQKPESTDYFCSSPLEKKALDLGGCKSVKENGRYSMSGENKELMRRNRLQVFRHITLHPKSP